MKISPISTSQNTFKAKRDDYITKAFLASKNSLGLTDKAIKALKNTSIDEKAMFASAFIVSGLSFMDIEKILRKHSITYCVQKSDSIKIASGYNNGFYIIKPQIKVAPEHTKEYLALALEKNSTFLGGLKNYMYLVKNIKRQDIVQRGLKTHSYELNCNIDPDLREIAAVNLSRLSKESISSKDLFFIDNEAFYYDKDYNTVYSINVFANQTETVKPTFRKCVFMTNASGRAIGYTTTEWDVFQDRVINTTYKEQQEPSDPLPKIADSANNKLFAEAFRFGNTKSDLILERSIPYVLKYLTEKNGVKNPQKEDLQFIKFFDKDKNIVKRIGYFDSTTGRSLIYDKDGRYMYQLEYDKNPFGSITACLKY